MIGFDISAVDSGLITAWLVESAARSTIILLLGLGVVALLRKSAARTRHAVLSVTFIASLLLPVLSLFAPSVDLAVLPADAEYGDIADARRLSAPTQFDAGSQGSTTLQDQATSGNAGALTPDMAALLGAGVSRLDDTAIGRVSREETRRPPRSHSEARSGVAVADPAVGDDRPMTTPGDETIAGVTREEVERAGAGRRFAGVGSLSLSRWAAMVWLLGAVLMLVSLRRGVARAHGLARTARTLDDAQWHTAIAHACSAVGVDRHVDVRIGDVPVPVAWGFRRPTILLPVDAMQWSGERRRIVLLHELTHIRRHDWVFQMVARTCCALHWFNPLAWTMARRHAIEREKACDDNVITVGTRPSVYAKHLLDVATFAGSRRLPVAALSMARPSQLEGRLVAILTRSKERVRGWAYVAAVLVALVAIPVAAVDVSRRNAVVYPPDATVEVMAAIGDGSWTIAQAPMAFDVTSLGDDAIVYIDGQAPIVVRTRVNDPLRVLAPAPRVPVTPPVVGRLSERYRVVAKAPRVPVFQYTPGQRLDALVPFAPMGQLEPLAPLAPAVPYAPLSSWGDSYTWIHHDDDRIAIENRVARGVPMRIEIEGDVEFSDDGKTITKMDRDGLVSIEVEEDGTEFSLEITRGSKDEFAYEWRIDGRKRDFDEDAKRFMEAALPIVATHIKRIEILGERNELLGDINSLLGDRNSLLGEINSVHGERNSLLGQINAYRSDRNAIRGEINAVYGERNALVGEINALRAAVRTHQVYGDSHESRAQHGELEGLRSNRRELLRQKRALAERLDEAKASERPELEKEMARLDRRIDDIDDEIREVKSDLKSDDAGYAYHYTTDSRYDDQIADLERRIEALNVDGRVRDLERAIAEAGVDERVEEVRRAIERLALEDRVSDVDRRIEELNVDGKVDDIRARIDALDVENRVESIDGNLEDLYDALIEVLDKTER